MRATTPLQRQVSIHVGKADLKVGSLTYVRQGRREHTAFRYDAGWLNHPLGFNVSNDLQFMDGYQSHKAAHAGDALFHGALDDTAPDAWGRRVIARDHAKRRKTHPDLAPLCELDYLLAVDDISRVGALRINRLGRRVGVATGHARRRGRR